MRSGINASFAMDFEIFNESNVGFAGVFGVSIKILIKFCLIVIVASQLAGFKKLKILERF